MQSVPLLPLPDENSGEEDACSSKPCWIALHGRTLHRFSEILHNLWIGASCPMLRYKCWPSTCLTSLLSLFLRSHLHAVELGLEARWNLVDDVSQFPFCDPRCPSLVLAASDIVRLSGNISHSPNPGSMFCFLDSDYGPVFRGSIFCVLYPVLCILLPCVQDSMIIVDTFTLKASQC